ncbi:carboxylate--amine ligase/circularly permuted type 2 ATP-grasp protein [Corynebacterium sanguinis]|uniref:carboxylate--amine ligase/circularly permuted type 2 ATP-grasp protein n=1 Tax=Corynebacterium sanguinis TaxID=2594913 RepID=UPI00223B58A0|nr:carboxylate--amine ligase/circularly permuted type 2 ATP-grasp protein [Corynebacterium sanguinis]MCT1804369.1 carboxylate--amine ligase/circularly permuted type 2 ATP-grasp protein [Corynebacterium sanguinis]MCT2159000.1 carboxylate--amine ligase/circularly permuted type 2 ATP-grasp protein [Corynebacterium sanguinis]
METRKMRVLEELQLVDKETRRLAPKADVLLSQLEGEAFTPSLQNSMIQVASGSHGDVTSLRDELLQGRAKVSSVAEPLGLGIAAAGTMPLAHRASLAITPRSRYMEMSADYALLAREQLICSAQIHVEVRDRDQAVAVSPGVSRHLPLLLALSASSPFSVEGSDTGYASSRDLTGQRWPTSGPFAPVSNAKEYDELVDTLIKAGVIADEAMMYYSLAPSISKPLLELRVCDSCPSVDAISTIAALFRAMVVREAALVDASTPTPPLNPTLHRSMMWRASRSGLEGSLICPETYTPRPAAEVLRSTVELLTDELRASGDLEMVTRFVEGIIRTGTSAYRQRRAYRSRGRLDDVVDQLMSETVGWLTEYKGTEGSLFGAYRPTTWVQSGYIDEAVEPSGADRDVYAGVLTTARELGAVELRKQQTMADRDLSAAGVTFRATGMDTQQAFPMDMVPRIITAREWGHLTAGVEQRAKALNLFLNDIYCDQDIVRDGIVGLDILEKSPGYRSTGRAAWRDTVRNHVSGSDLIFSEAGWQILEDNVRQPSGIAFGVEARKMMERNYPELFATAPQPLNDPTEGYAMMGETLAAALPPHPQDDPRIVVVTRGKDDPSYFEQVKIAEVSGIDLVLPQNLLIEDNVAWEVGPRGRRRIDVMYLRMDEDMFLSSRGADGAELRYKILRAITAGNVTVANALGNGVGDDKAVYAYVPQMIEYYLGEKPILASVPTYLCAIREHRDRVLERLDQLVVKPIDGYGGAGITIGPEAGDEELQERRQELLVKPEQFVAQEVVGLSTLPTFDGAAMQPRHVDLRVFTHLRASGSGVTVHTAPAGLTRVAPAGSLVVNSSRGGGGKDTWIVTEGQT